MQQNMEMSIINKQKKKSYHQMLKYKHRPRKKDIGQALSSLFRFIEFTHQALGLD